MNVRDARDRFEQWFRTHYADLCRYALSVVGTQSDAEDVVQEVFAELWSRRTTWAPHTSVRAYLFRAVRNNALNARDRHSVTHRDEADLRNMGKEEALPDDILRHDELHAAIRAAVAQMPDRQREVFQLSRHGGLTYRETARVLGISESTVDTHMVRALRFLRDEIRVHL